MMDKREQKRTLYADSHFSFQGLLSSVVETQLDVGGTKKLLCDAGVDDGDLDCTKAEIT